MSRTHLNLKLDPELKKQLQEEADEQVRSLSNLVDTILRAHVASRKQKESTQ